MDGAQNPKIKFNFVTLDKKSNMSVCGDEKSFEESAARKIWRRRNKI